MSLFRRRAARHPPALTMRPAPAPPPPRMPKVLTTGQGIALASAVGFAVLGMTVGLWYSYANITAAAAAHGWNPPYGLALMIDSGLPTYVIIDHLIVTLGGRSVLPRLTAWGFAALSILLNGAVSNDPSLLWRVVHMAAPGAWVLGVEMLRLLWRVVRRTQQPKPKTGRIPAGRWLAAPRATFLLWRRMHLLGVTSWERMCALEDARLFLRDLVKIAGQDDVPFPLRRAIRTGRLPGAVVVAVDAGLPAGDPSQMEAAVQSWAASRMTLGSHLEAGIETALAAISQKAPEMPSGGPSETAPETPPETVPETAPETVSETVSGNPSERAPGTAPGTASEKAPRTPPERTDGMPSGTATRKPSGKPRRPDGRKVREDAPVIEWILDEVGSGEFPSKGRIMRDYHVGEPRAAAIRAALEATRRPRLVEADSR